MISSRKDDEANRQIKNRRFMALQKLKQGDYFSLESMRMREPLLFDTMIAENLNDSGKFKKLNTIYY